MLVLLLQPLTFFVPFLLVVIIDGWRGLRETWLAALVVSVAFSAVQGGASVVPRSGARRPRRRAWPAMAAIVVLSRVLEAPAHLPRGRRRGAGSAPSTRSREIAVAWSPFYILTAFILVWSIPAFKDLFAEGGTARVGGVQVPHPGSHRVRSRPRRAATVTQTWDFTPLERDRHRDLPRRDRRVLLRCPSSPPATCGPSSAARCASSGRPITLIALILVLANIANYSGGSATIGVGAGRHRPALPAGGADHRLVRRVHHGFGRQQQHPVRAAAGDDGEGHRRAADGARSRRTPRAGRPARSSRRSRSRSRRAPSGSSGRESEILRASIGYSLGMLAVICVWTFTLVPARSRRDGRGQAPPIGALRCAARPSRRDRARSSRHCAAAARSPSTAGGRERRPPRARPSRSGICDSR